MERKNVVITFILNRVPSPFELVIIEIESLLNILFFLSFHKPSVRSPIRRHFEPREEEKLIVSLFRSRLITSDLKFIEPVRGTFNKDRGMRVVRRYGL